MQYKRNHNITPELKEQLKQLVPEAFQDGQLNIDVLKSLIGEEETTDNSQEHFELTWVGKRQARKQAAQPPIGTLVPAKGEGINEETTNNIFIEGENLEVLRLLRQAYKSKIKMIYIDPPYNTGNDFVYKDNFAENKQQYLDQTGENLVSNPKSQGRFHANWLNFMYPRLRVAKDLLTDDGVIFISIDDNEVHNLRLLMDEVFGGENYISEFIWEKKFAPQNDAKYISLNHEQIICYGKNKVHFERKLLPMTDEQLKRYKNPDNDPRGVWQSDNLTVATYSKEYDYPIKKPNGELEYPVKGRCWQVPKETMDKLIKDNRIWFGKQGGNVPRLKRFLSEVKKGVVPISILYNKDVGHTQEATKELKRIFNGNKFFDFPKPVSLIKRLGAITLDSSDIVLDFFAGSGTTAQAVLELNKDDGGNRQFICVQIPEATPDKSEAKKAGYATIAEITKERIRRVIKQLTPTETTEEIEEDNTEQQTMDFGEEQKTEVTTPTTQQDLGFKVFKSTDSNFRAWLPLSNLTNIVQELDFHATSPFVDEATNDGIITEVMLNEGYPLHAKKEQVEAIKSNMIWHISSDYVPYDLYICLDKLLLQDTLDKLPSILSEKDLFICIDTAFGDANDGIKVTLKEYCQLKTL